MKCPTCDGELIEIKKGFVFYKCEKCNSYWEIRLTNKKRIDLSLVGYGEKIN